MSKWYEATSSKMQQNAQEVRNYAPYNPSYSMIFRIIFLQKFPCELSVQGYRVDSFISGNELECLYKGTEWIK